MWKRGRKMKPIALFSLNDISYADDFAEKLIKSGWEIIGSHETVDLLKKKGLPVKDIADFTGVKEDYGFPPTLHPKVEYTLTKNVPSRIDIVYVIPYPFSVGNDVGGRTLLALAVKGGRIPVMNIEDMKKVVTEISEKGEVSQILQSDLMDKASFEIAKHNFSLIVNRKKYDFFSGRFSYDLLNGENPYQIPASAFISETKGDLLSLMNFEQVSGEAPCFTNIADADCILRTLCLIAESYKLNTNSIPYLCIAAKHGNACGIGVSTLSPAQAVEKALFGDPLSVWGGEVITNFSIDMELAELLYMSDSRKKCLGEASWMLDLIMAPSFNSEAISILGKRRGRKLFKNSELFSPLLEKTEFVYRFVRGGFLRQPPANYILNLKACQIEGNVLSDNEISSLIIAWGAAFSSNCGGNEIALAKDGALLSVGGGPSTIAAAKVVILRLKECGHDGNKSVFAADAFFPFTDAPSVLCNAGVLAGCVPCGGKHENDVKNTFRKNNVTMVYLPPEYRGFCRH